MRLKIPKPVQLWFNTISTTAKRHRHMEKVEEEVNDDTSVPSPLIVGTIQNLCYEIFAIPVCTSDAVNMAQTICGHIYDLAQSSSPALQLIVLDLIPTLVHVYLVLSTTFSSSFGSFSINQRVSVSHCHAKYSFPTGVTTRTSAAAATTSPEVALPRGRKSLRHRLKKSSVVSVDALRRPSFNRTVRQRTRRILAGFTSDPANTSNVGATAAPADSSTHSSSSVTATTARSCNTTTSTPTSLPTSQKASAIGTHMASLAAVLEALLVGLYNTYVRQLVVPRRGANLFSALPPFASGSVFCGPLDMTKTKEDQETEIVESFLHLFPNRDSTAHVVEECQLTACNRWRVLCLLCRISIERINDLSDRGREALCHLALLLGPRGLREHRFPPPVATVTADVSPPRRRRRSRWQRFARHHHQERHSKGAPPPSLPLEPRASTPLQGSQRQSNRVIAAAARLDLTRITAPLRSVPAVQREGTSTSMDMQPSLNMVGLQKGKKTRLSPMHKVLWKTANPLMTMMLMRMILSLQIATPPAFPLHQQQHQQQEQLCQQQLPQQQESHTPTAPVARISDFDEKKKSKRHQFHGLPRGSGVGSGGHTKTEMVGMLVASVRIPRLPAQFVLDLLPGLHFALTTTQSHLAATAVDALAQRANLELWSNVLLYTNSIRNSKVYVHAATASLDQNCIALSARQSNQSNGSRTLRGVSPGGSRASSIAGSGASSTLEEERRPASPVTVIETSRQSKVPMAITNASFQAVRPEEDIPLMVNDERVSSVGNNVLTASAPPPSPLRSTPSYQNEEESPPRKLQPRSKSFSPHHKRTALPLPSRGFLRLNCASCNSCGSSSRQRTLSFNSRPCGALRNSRPKSPYNLKVTFADESGIGNREVLSPPLPAPLPASPPTPRSI
uniref:Hyccin n=1 Tax=Echinococcus granulosus TaxID=6210 RepID=A0A068WTF2_ECHGR|nr:Hyccin [Echinococcus granulosus]